MPSPNLNPDGGSLLTELLRTIENSFCVTFREHIAYPAFKRPREQIHAANEATLQYLFGIENWEVIISIIVHSYTTNLTILNCGKELTSNNGKSNK